MKLTNLLSLNFIVPWVAQKIDNTRAIRGLQGMPRNILLVGHKHASGALPLNEIKQVSTQANAQVLAGESQLLDMFNGAFDNAGLGLPIHMIALDDAGLTARKTRLTFTGTPTKAGAVPLWIGGVSVPVLVDEKDTQDAVASKVMTAINAHSKVRFTAVVNANVVTLTCDVKGAVANSLDVRVGYYDDEILVDGLTVTINHTDGVGAPNIAPLIAAMENARYTEIVFAFTDSVSMKTLENELSRRWSFDNAQDSQAVCAISGTEGQNAAWLSSRNSQNVHTICTTKDLTPTWVTAAMAGAVIEKQNSVDPAKPYASLKLRGYLPAKTLQQFTELQRNVMLLAGGSVLIGGEINRIVTNYTENGLGVLDKSYRNLNWVKTLSFWRYTCVSEFQLKYRDYKLSDDPEQKPLKGVMDRDLAQTIMLRLYDQFVEAGLMVRKEFYKDNLVIDIDATNGKLKYDEQPVIMTQHYQTEITTGFVAGEID